MWESWIEAYLLLALRLDRASRAISSQSPLVDYYYGPSELGRSVDEEQLMSPTQLLSDTGELLATIDDESFDEQRRRYLTRHIVALETVCRRLCGETFGLVDEVQRCFGVTPAWIDERTFAYAWEEADAALPGQDSLEERLRRVRLRYLLPRERSQEVLALLERTLAEARKRTLSLVALPPGEAVTVWPVTDQAWGANARYQGNLLTHIEVNLDIPLNVRTVLETACHEGYPGHHTELSWREQHLVRDGGHLEHSVGLLVGPQALLSEGLAMTASSLIFSPEERQRWLVNDVYVPLGLGDASPPEHLGPSSMDVRNNVAFLLRDGVDHAEAVRYLERHLRLPPERAEREFAYVTRPLRDLYVTTYTSGRQLVRRWLDAGDVRERLGRFLHGQLLPEDLDSQLAASGGPNQYPLG